MLPVQRSPFTYLVVPQVLHTLIRRVLQGVLATLQVHEQSVALEGKRTASCSTSDQLHARQQQRGKSSMPAAPLHLLGPAPLGCLCQCSILSACQGKHQQDTLLMRTQTHTQKYTNTCTHTHGYACAQEGMRLRMSTRWCTLAGHALLSAPTVVVSMKTGSEMLRMPGMASTQACTVLQGALGEDASVLASSSFAALVFSFSSAACTPTRTAPHAPACLAKRTCGCADPVALVLY